MPSVAPPEVETGEVVQPPSPSSQTLPLGFLGPLTRCLASLGQLRQLLGQEFTVLSRSPRLS